MKLGGRGALIIFEGCDRSGKSTQCQRLVKYLNEKNCQHVNKDDLPAAKLMRFPDRTTQSGKEIDSYLQGKIQLDDKKIHLLFSNNRWEKDKEIQAAMVAGQTVIVDRYAFSGVAFSAAKEGMSMEWCREPDRGLPKPDMVCFLDVSPQEAAKRGGFGNERYETQEFQAKVRTNYNHLMEDNWNVVDTDNLTLDEVFNKVKIFVEDVVARPDKGPIMKLWPKD